ncbi:unnamed protein product [Litomosoides sigmodontis]|uniref:C-type lectin domain-containing protein n=1 Tax=Litomosoides sigmodontis TaxID=42156 RepID=A0A3P6TVS0_LITSI|nr:unnamed protein product [Litomosoides sigmodontis]
MAAIFQVIALGVNGEPKLGPCPEKWFALLPANVDDFALLQKCIAHIDVASLQPKVQKLADAINACSHMFDNTSTTATIFRPENARELQNFLTLAGNVELEGMMDVFAEGKIPYDHAGNDLRKLGERIMGPISTAPDKQCAWNSQKVLPYAFETPKPVLRNYKCNGGGFKADHGKHYRTSARNARNTCRQKRAQLLTIDSVAEWSYITRLANALAPRTRDRSLLLGYTRCGTDQRTWRTMEDGQSPKNVPFLNTIKANGSQCCLELNMGNEKQCK